MCFHLYLKGQAQQFTFETESILLYSRGRKVKGVEVSEYLASVITVGVQLVQILSLMPCTYTELEQRKP